MYLLLLMSLGSQRSRLQGKGRLLSYVGEMNQPVNEFSLARGG